MEELMKLAIYWQKVSAIAACSYVILVFVTLIYVIAQVRELRKNRKLQTALALFKELQAKKMLGARRYIYKQLPTGIEDLSEETLETHVIACEEALKPFHRVGYLLQEGHIDPHPILANYWAVVWRCWRRAESLIRWSREKRGNPMHLDGFDYLYRWCEEYRRANYFPEPKFY